MQNAYTQLIREEVQMSMIKLTGSVGDSLYINAIHITAIERTDTALYTTIYTSCSTDFLVKETVEQIVTAIHNQRNKPINYRNLSK